jgi:hypothetical protein
MNAWTTPTFWRLPRESFRIWTFGSSSSRSATELHAPRRAAQCREVIEQLGCRELTEVPRVASEVGEPAVDRDRVAPCVEAEDGRPPGRRADEAGEEADRGRLPGTVRAEESEDLPFMNPDFEVDHASPASVILGELEQLDRVAHQWHPRARSR